MSTGRNAEDVQLEKDIRAWEESKVKVCLINGRRIQCKDIPNTLVVETVRRLTVEHRTTTAVRVRAALDDVLGPVPAKLFLAKTRKLITAGKLDGCGCGCRGDFAVPATPPYLWGGFIRRPELDAEH